MIPFLISYADPGSGAMLVQAIIASFVGAGAWVTNKLFRRSKEKKEPSVVNSGEIRADASFKSKTRLP